MKNIWISELERVFKRKKTIVGIIIYLLLVGFQCLFLWSFGVGFYNAEEAVYLNNLNAAPFFLRELGIFLIFILIPMFVVDSFNGECSSGAYQLILTRPQDRAKLFIVKWAVQAVIILALLAVTWVVTTLFGNLLFPTVTETPFYQIEGLQVLQAYGYSLLFYVIAALVLLSVIALGGVISTIMPNTIISYLAIIGMLVGAIYLSDHFIFYFSLSDSIFDVLGGENHSLLILVFLIMVISFIINITVWKKRDWMG
ncbi:ABC transporter permease subunit [Gracilibacillus sp. S3-1-1]|uniref:ABC transporter permease subunit n=1 Tax=Gracilibacillus pellucidus TaxID=3095368 RepID=A0ACC6M134_9BACI|nr:ABC transporter permease [Gracilibacillus sp. S3-1-1]MDX8044442.1 ABC transporter permease subunit [Gracilibacillus sp. S3-1-1]